ncbi:DNA-binding protein [Streptomyces albus subsp. albus]|nr:DNA-binding protein [Streptomyces albus subsp. albus]
MMHDELAWRKSSYSGEHSADTNCVEAAATPTTIHIRDSKNTSGPALAVPPTAWAEFLRLIV